MFGSMRDAYLAAGFDRRPSRYTDKQIVASLRALKHSLGRFPTRTEISAASRTGHCPVPDTITRRLGSLADLQEWV
jgi:hypothetical protein